MIRTSNRSVLHNFWILMQNNSAIPKWHSAIYASGYGAYFPLSLSVDALSASAQQQKLHAFSLSSVVANCDFPSAMYSLSFRHIFTMGKNHFSQCDENELCARFVWVAFTRIACRVMIISTCAAWVSLMYLINQNKTKQQQKWERKKTAA